MITGEASSDSLPFITASAPRLLLHAEAKGVESATIECRRLVTLLGSRNGCKVNLHGNGISPVHAAIVNTGTELQVVDLLTPGGTKLNGLRLVYDKITTDDVLSINGWEFRAEILPPEQVHRADAHAMPLDPAPDVFALEHATSRRLLQPTREACVLGRRKGSDIVINDGQVSRVHAMVVRYFGFPAIFDLLSKNGLSVNNRQVKFRFLQDGDAIQIGDAKFIVRAKDGQVPPSNGNGSNGKVSPSIAVGTSDVPTDLIDIQATEGSQRWRIAESLERTQKKKK